MPPENLKVDGVPAEYPDDAADPPQPSHPQISGSCQGCMDLVYHGCWLPSCCATSKKPRANGCSVRAHPRLAGVCLVLWAGDGCPAHPFEVTAVACAVPARAAPAGAAAGGWRRAEGWLLPVHAATSKAPAASSTTTAPCLIARRYARRRRWHIQSQMRYAVPCRSLTGAGPAGSATCLAPAAAGR